jgi:hypothetical protein
LHASNVIQASRLRFRTRPGFLHLPPLCCPTTRLLYTRVQPVCLPPRIKRSKRKTDSTPTSDAEVKNAWALFLQFPIRLKLHDAEVMKVTTRPWYDAARVTSIYYTLTQTPTLPEISMHCLQKPASVRP